ncbi:MAG: deoxyribose-phosphate aldolase, partial [Spirochaetae bacterium HGW-Spirochaetae-7]
MTNEWTKASIARTIDHTLLKAIATEQQVRELCIEAKANGFASVCVNPCWVPLCAKELSNSKVLVCTVIGFPLGANATETKAAEAALAIRQGAEEVDMVINLGAAKAGDWKVVEEDIRSVVAAVGNTTVKVIIETCYLTDAEKVR